MSLSILLALVSVDVVIVVSVMFYLSFNGLIYVCILLGLLLSDKR